STVDFDLIVQTPANGTFTIPISLPSGSAGSSARFDNNIVTAIPDNSFVDSSVVVSGITTPIKRVTVSLHLLHASDSQLDISLIGPDGTTVDLSSDNGSTGDNYGTNCADRSRTLFTDTAVTSITAGAAPFEGSFRPEQPLSAFNEKSGAEVNGIWRLRIADDAAGTVGSLQCWSLFLSPTVCSDGGGACESCPENRVIHGILGPGSLVQTNRLNRNSIVSACGVAKPCPGAVGVAGDRFYDAYVFENGESNACITVTLEAPCELFSAAYTNSYAPANLCQNYLADPGSSIIGGPKSYFFSVGAGARFAVIVHAVNPGESCDYTLSVDGGSCRPVLNIVQTSPTQVALDWTTAAIGFGLERTNALPNLPAAVWPAV